MIGKNVVTALLSAFLCGGVLPGAAQAEPVTFRYGHSVAAEEQLWLMFARPDLFQKHKHLYKVEYSMFPSNQQSMQAMVADAIDMSSFSANGSISAFSEGIKIKLIASLSKESTKGFSSTFFTLADSPIKELKDMKGKTVAVNGFSTAGHAWVKAALEKAGLTESDINLVPIRFPAMAESLAAKKIDVGMFPQPFAAMAEQQLKMRKLFTAAEVVPFDQELTVIGAKEEFLKKNEAAVKGFLMDLRDATKFYLDKPKEARQMLIDAKFVRVPADIFLNLTDYYHDTGMALDVGIIEKMQDMQIKAGFQKNRADMKALVDNSYLPK